MSRFDCRRCDWRPEREEDAPSPEVQLLEHSMGSGHPLCVVCARSLEATEQQSCLECVATARRGLDEIVDLYALLPGELGHATAAAPDSPRPAGFEPALPGGSVLSLLGPGSAGAHQRGRERSSRLSSTPWRSAPRLRHPGVVWSADAQVQVRQAAEVSWEPGEANDNLPTDAPSVAFELSRWEDDWRSVRGEPAATRAATVVGAVAYLSPNCGWAGMYHPAFDEFVSDVRALLRRLRDATATSTRPQRGAPCFDCGVALVREYGQDHYRCLRCRREYDDESYWLAVKARMEDEAAGGAG